MKPYGTVEWWNIGYQKLRKWSFWFRTASLEDRFAEARGKEFLAFSLKTAQADAPPTFIKVIPIHEPIIPVFHYSNILAGVKRALESTEKYV